MQKSLRRIIVTILMIAVYTVFVAGDVSTVTVEAKTKSKYTIYVNRRENIVNVVKTKTGKNVRSMYCSVGLNSGTITGVFHTKEKYRWRALYHNSYGQYATRISGPFLFHSVPYSKMKSNKLYNEEYNKLGEAASMGCVRLAVIDAKWIYDNCKTGTKVVINDTRKMKKPKRDLLKVTSRKKYGWDPTDPDENNPYYPVITVVNYSERKLLRNSKADLKTFVEVKSKTTPTDVLAKYLKVKGEVDTSVPGKYKVTYEVKDPYTGITATKTVKFKVLKKMAPATEAETLESETTAEVENVTEVETLAETESTTEVETSK